MLEYFCVDTTKMSLAESWRWGISSFVQIVLHRLRGASIRTSVFPRGEPYVISKSDLGSRMCESFESAVRESEDLGFRFQFFYTVPLLGEKEAATAAFDSNDHRIVLIQTKSRVGDRWDHGCAMYSRDAGETILATGNSRYTFQPPPEFSVVRLMGKPLPAIYRRHRRRLQRAVDLATFQSTENIREFIFNICRRITDHQIERGVFVPMSDDSVRDAFDRPSIG